MSEVNFFALYIQFYHVMKIYIIILLVGLCRSMAYRHT